jgi:hypothetical protein
MGSSSVAPPGEPWMYTNGPPWVPKKRPTQDRLRRSITSGSKNLHTADFLLLQRNRSLSDTFHPFAATFSCGGCTCISATPGDPCSCGLARSQCSRTHHAAKFPYGLLDFPCSVVPSLDFVQREFANVILLTVVRQSVGQVIRDDTRLDRLVYRRRPCDTI